YGLKGGRLAWCRNGQLRTSTEQAMPASLLIAQISPRTINEGETLTVPLTVTNPVKGSTLTYSNNLPTGATFDEATATFSWTPPYTFVSGSSSRTTTASFSASNGTQTATASLAITVLNRNAPPEFTSDCGAWPGAEIKAETTYTCSITATDPEGEAVNL